MSKAEIYTLTHKHIIVTTDDKGNKTVEFVPTETRAVQRAQDRGIETVSHRTDYELAKILRQKS